MINTQTMRKYSIQKIVITIGVVALPAPRMVRLALQQVDRKKTESYKDK
jgi:hypothetical protein